MFDARRLLGQVLGEALGGSFGGKRRRARGPLAALGVGKAQVGLGLLGLAFAAYEHYKPTDGRGTDGQPATANLAGPGPGSPALPPPPPMPPPPPGARATEDDRALHLLRAMIAAAHADGGIDDTERAALLDRARAAGLDGGDLSVLDVEMRAPMTAAQIAARTPAGLQEETWVAAFVAAMPDTDEEQRFLAGLGEALGFDARARLAIAQKHGLT
jgi:uncharacterized membrane protein YebE (DUF533 family)